MPYVVGFLLVVVGVLVYRKLRKSKASRHIDWESGWDPSARGKSNGDNEEEIVVITTKEGEENPLDFH